MEFKLNSSSSSSNLTDTLLLLSFWKQPPHWIHNYNLNKNSFLQKTNFRMSSKLPCPTFITSYDVKKLFFFPSEKSRNQFSMQTFNSNFLKNEIMQQSPQTINEISCKLNSQAYRKFQNVCKYYLKIWGRKKLNSMQHDRPANKNFPSEWETISAAISEKIIFNTRDVSLRLSSLLLPNGKWKLTKAKEKLPWWGLELN